MAATDLHSSLQQGLGSAYTLERELGSGGPWQLSPPGAPPITSDPRWESLIRRIGVAP